MTDALWSRTWDLFHEAMELRPDERAEFLAAACGTDHALRREIEELIANASSSGMLDRSPGAVIAIHEPAEIFIGKRIGNYVVRRHIGSGGMAMVYEAEQESPVRRRVALKLIHAGTSADAAARFAIERQALALMDHPNIARVFDAGLTEDGRPFIAMEYVEGVPLGEYCDRQSLDVPQRLRLFAQVCKAIQHAHQKGIIHRDIKPSNVLVTVVDGVPMPKVIDFGVAKAVVPLADVDGGARTHHGLLIGTVEYMSPEQLDPHGNDIDTRSDIYSLGAMLYELLAGVLPFDWSAIRKAGLDGLYKTARESEARPASARFRELDPERAARIAAARRSSPTQLRRDLEGDVDWILLKALDRERARRYSSAAEFADDIRRRLDNEPVLAGPPTARYRLRKFARRHRAGVVAAGLIAIALAVVATALTMQTIEIRRAAARAERERVRAERVSEVMTDIFDAADPLEGRGSEVTARQALDRSAARIARMTDEPQVKAAVLHAIARSYTRLRVYDSAEKYAHEALAIRRRIHAGDHIETAETLEILGRIYLLRANIPAAMRALEQGVAMKTRLLTADDPRRAEGLVFLASAQRSEGRFVDAERSLREALRISPDDNVTVLAREEYGNLSVRRGDLVEADKQYRAALVVRRKTGSEPRIAETASKIGTVAWESGDYAGAEVMLREALSLIEKHAGPDHESLAVPLGTLALALHFQSKYDEAARAYERSLAIWRKRHGDSHPNVTMTLNNLGLLAHDQGRFAEAERYFRETMALQHTYSKKEIPEFALPMSNIARLYHDQGKYAEAESLYRQALDIRRRLLKPGSPAIADTLGWLGKLLTETNRVAEAESMIREALKMREANLRRDDWRVAEMRSLLGANLAAQHRYAEAEPLLVEGYEGMLKKRGPNYRRTIQARQRMIDMYEKRGKAPTPTS